MPTKKKETAAKKDRGEDKKNESEKRFERDLLIRGEAAKPLPNGELPPGATHKIVEKEDGSDQIEQERFSIC